MAIDRNFPQITPVQWLAAREVLGGEASDFTPWLRQPESLEALGAARKLDELTAIASEHNVLGKRLDILATALDEDGDEIAVCIENQYGTSDGDHLGRLIAYLAQHERGRAVWVVEHPHDAFVAAVRFLNRTSSDEVGYFLVQVRFTHGLNSGYQVHYEVLAAPIAWERPARRTARAVNTSKVGHVLALRDAVQPELLDLGFPNLNAHARGAYIWVRWPEGLWFRQYAKRLSIRVTKHAAIVAVFVNMFATREANSEAVSIMEATYGSALATRVPAGSEIRWHPSGFGERDGVRVELPGAGYPGGDIDSSATWAVEVCRIWLELLRDSPITDLGGRVRDAVPDASEQVSDEDEDEAEAD